jgi:hypothetical protein
MGSFHVLARHDVLSTLDILYSVARLYGSKSSDPYHLLQFARDGRIRNTDRYDDLFLLIKVADHRFNRVTSLAG